MTLNAFQLRAARSALTIGVREIGNIIGVSRTTISIWENRKNFELIKTTQENNNNLIIFFREQGISFPNKKSIELNINTNNKFNLLSRFQMRVARIAMNLTQEELSQQVDIPLSLLNYLENRKNNIYISNTPKKINEQLLRNFFEVHGIKFPKEFCVYLEKDPRELINNY